MAAKIQNLSSTKSKREVNSLGKIFKNLKVKQLGENPWNVLFHGFFV